MQILEQKEEISSFLSFEMNEEMFAMDVRSVIEILEVPTITKVPKTPDYIYGVINLRGKVLPIIDTRVKFGMTGIELEKETCVIVTELNVEDNHVIVGALVDKVYQVFESKMSDMKASPTINPNYNLDFILGMIPDNERFVMLLNVSRVFTLADMDEIQKSENSKK